MNYLTGLEEQRMQIKQKIELFSFIVGETVGENKTIMALVLFYVYVYHMLQNNILSCKVQKDKACPMGLRV